MTGYTPAELALMTTTELLHMLEAGRLTPKQIREIKTELKTRVI